jgi:hypothetical protein
MKTDTPIACTLSAAEQARRFAASDAIAGRWMLDATTTDSGVSMRFRAGAEHGLRELIAAESECCPFLEFELNRDGPDLRLTVEGPAMARTIIYDLFGLEAQPILD